MSEENTTDPQDHVQISLSKFEPFRRSFLTEEAEEWDGYRQDYYHLSKEQEDELQPLIGIDKVAEMLLISSASRCAMGVWSKWKGVAKATGAFGFPDVIQEVSEICAEAMADFDPSRSKRFASHAIGRVNLRFIDFARPAIHEAKTGKNYPATTFDRFTNDPDHELLSEAVKEDLRATFDLSFLEDDSNSSEWDLHEPTAVNYKLISLNASHSDDEGSGLEVHETIPDDSGRNGEDAYLDREREEEVVERWKSFGMTAEESEALILWMDQGLSTREVGKEMGLNKGTITARLTKAAKKLGKTLEELEATRQALLESAS